jgi:hypothetical protein
MEDNTSFEKMAEDFLAENSSDDLDFMELVSDEAEGEIAGEARLYIVQLDDRVEMGDEIEAHDIDFCFECLKSEHLLLSTQAAVFLSGHSKETIIRMTEEFSELNHVMQKFLVVLLVGTEFVEAYTFLLDVLKTSDDAHLKPLIVEALSKTEYFIFPLLMVRLDDKDDSYRTDILSILEKMGFRKVEAFLAMFPYLPHERDFRRIYGNRNIDSLYK